MRLRLAVLVGCVLCSAMLAGRSAPATEPHNSAAEEELVRLEHEWLRASLVRDRDWLESFIANEATITHPTSGTVKDKRREIADTVDPSQVPEQMTLLQASAVLFGEPPSVGIVTGRSSETGGGGHLTDRHRVYQFTDTFMKRGRNWQLIASHASRLPE